MPSSPECRPSPRRIAVVAAALMVLAGCTPAASGTPDAASGTQAFATPVTVSNCGAEVSFAAPPRRVVLLKSASVPFLAELGVLDRVVARAGAYPQEYYDDATWAAVERIPVLTDRLDPGGHLLISREEVIAQKPDLVVGEVDNLDRATLAASGIPLLEEPTLCGTGAARPGYDDVAEQMMMYGRVFGREDAAASANDRLAERLTGIRARVSADETRTAAVLYPTVGGGVTYAYGTGSMAHPQLEAAGLTNVFGDVDARVFEVTREELIGRDPDVLILLYSEGDPAAVEKAVTTLTGLDRVTAVRDGAIVTQLLNFTEPPTPLTLDGLQNILDRIGPPR